MINEKHVEMAAKHVEWERDWVKKVTGGDPLFARLANNHRDRLYVGRMFVAWTVADGAPIINTLFRVHTLSLGERGLAATITTATAARDLTYLKLDHIPKQAPGLELYLWLPNFSEVRYAPANPNNPDSQCYCSVPLLARYQHPPSLSQVPGRLYFASKSEFVALWPSHDF